MKRKNELVIELEKEIKKQKKENKENLYDELKNLSDEQTLVFKKVMEGKNVFCTGEGGTGKSFLKIRKIIFNRFII